MSYYGEYCNSCACVNICQDKAFWVRNCLDRIEPVKHGQWVWNDECKCFVCNNCFLSALNNYRGWSTESNFCPHCGADMRG